MIPWLDADTPFPSVDRALTSEQGAPGLLAAGADLTFPRLLDAYKKGIFPWYSEDQPILWWSTDPRMVLYTDEFKISKSLKKILRKFQNCKNIEFKFDTAFNTVMRECAKPRVMPSGVTTGTWISEPMILAYNDLYSHGFAHSAEMWKDGVLVGGAYGVCIGRMFFGESMFSRIDDASKAVLAHLVYFLRSNNVKIIDCQQETRHLASLGGRAMARSEFVKWVEQAVEMVPIKEWKMIGSDADTGA